MPTPRDLIPLFFVATRDPVPFKSSVEKSLSCRDGELKFDPAMRVVLAKPNEFTKRDPLIIPLENVLHMVELSSVLQEKLNKAKSEAAAPKPAAEPAGAVNTGRVKFVKDEFGAIKEVRE